MQVLARGSQGRRHLGTEEAASDSLVQGSYCDLRAVEAAALDRRLSDLAALTIAVHVMLHGLCLCMPETAAQMT